MVFRRKETGNRQITRVSVDLDLDTCRQLEELARARHIRGKASVIRLAIDMILGRERAHSSGRSVSQIHLSEQERGWITRLSSHYNLQPDDVIRMLIRLDHSRILHQEAIERAEEQVASRAHREMVVRHPLSSADIYTKDDLFGE